MRHAVFRAVEKGLNHFFMSLYFFLRRLIFINNCWCKQS